MYQSTHDPSSQNSIKYTISQSSLLCISIFEIYIMKKSKGKEDSPAHKTLEYTTLYQIATEKSCV